MRNPISSKLRFAITLRYLARGNSYKSFEYLSRVSRVTIENFVSQVCNAVITILKGKYLKVPCTTEAWNQISLDFQTRWQFPHALGALDGKHICIQAPSHEGSYYFNYKGFHSIVFLALVDAHYNLIFIDCGGKGRISDGGIYKNSSLYKALHSRQQGIPYCIVGDDAFALSHTLILCRARRVVENAFGILCTRFRISTRPMNTNLKTTESIVMCCCALHNFLRPASLLSTENRPMPDVLPNIVHEGGNFSSNRARQIRDEFVNYFVQE
nr:unnamed protein product [Callosobruchus analis]CAI5853630.1 unnamed protein product [Callosobruchus analis]